MTTKMRLQRKVFGDTVGIGNTRDNTSRLRNIFDSTLGVEMCLASRLTLQFCLDHDNFVGICRGGSPVKKKTIGPEMAPSPALYEPHCCRGEPHSGGVPSSCR